MLAEKDGILGALDYSMLIDDSFYTRDFTITPEEARLILLNHNEKNRPLNQARCMKLAESIKRGEWQFNGDMIRFGKTGQLLDGQHRLQAIVIANQPVRSMVCFNLEDESFCTIDVDARPRNSSDVLAIDNYAHYTTLAAALRLVMLFDYAGIFYPRSSKFAPSAAQILQFAREIDRDFLDEICRDANNHKNVSRFVGKGFQIAFRFMLRHRTDERHFDFDLESKGKEFIDKLDSGTSLESNHPILQLRERYIANVSDKSKKLNKETAYCLFVKAFYLFIHNKKLQVLRLHGFDTTVARNTYALLFVPAERGYGDA